MSVVVHRARMKGEDMFSPLPTGISVVKVAVGWLVVRRIEGLEPDDRYWRPSYRTAMRKYGALIDTASNAGLRLDLTSRAISGNGEGTDAR